MPLVTSSYTTSGWWKNPHIATIYAAKLRTIRGVSQYRQRYELPDGDFLDIDWTYAHGQPEPNLNTRRLALLFHGLEGNAQRSYMLGMAKLLSHHGYDVAAVNFRGCSGEPNRLYRSYHSGDTGDIRWLVDHFTALDTYTSIALYGVSLGGNAILKYLGESTKLPAIIKAVSTIGVPSDLKASLEQLVQPANIIYRTSFLWDLRAKYRRKLSQFPEEMSEEIYKKIDSLETFDEHYTAPAHGFKSALDYYAKASSYPFLPAIAVPTLMLNAKNDTFLHGRCYPVAEADSSEFLYLETPEYGGHVGFYKKNEYYYHELRTLEFFNEFIE